ncbi:hypothetical protein GBA52_021801 [Prunus armeniaca]|nr:hypothetical protein GBA52_021801 [Prunus armeniaca]
MALKPKAHLGLIPILIFFISINPRPSLSLSESPATVFEILPKYGLPSGLLPASVSNYTLSDDGRFVVVLGKPCYVQFEYLVYYEKTITGKLTYGAITELKGIQVQSCLSPKMLSISPTLGSTITNTDTDHRHPGLS